MAEQNAQPRTALTVIFLTVFIDLLGFGIVLPLLPYYATQFHASAATAGALIAIYSAMQFFCAPLWGRWSDRIGRRPVILVSLAGSTLSYLLFALANDVAVLFLSRILAGVAGANIPVAAPGDCIRVEPSVAHIICELLDAARKVGQSRKVHP